MNKKGFTLIELLVVISIIAILTTIGLVIFQHVLKGSRDAKRQSDLKFIQSALEQYHADQKYYPTTQLTPGNSLVFGNKTYLAQIPADPQPAPQPNYSYVPSPSNCNNAASKCTSYCLFTKLEGTPPAADSRCPPSSSYNFSVSKP